MVCPDWETRPHWLFEHTPAKPGQQILRGAFDPPRGEPLGGELGDFLGVPVVPNALVPPGYMYLLGNPSADGDRGWAAIDTRHPQIIIMADERLEVTRPKLRWWRRWFYALRSLIGAAARKSPNRKAES